MIKARHKEDIFYSSIYINFKNRQLIHSDRNQMVVTLGRELVSVEGFWGAGTVLCLDLVTVIERLHKKLGVVLLSVGYFTYLTISV